jgi:hypothetical protein
MKREAHSHTKIKMLGRKLNLPHYACVGILETLWYLTARQTPQGDIGRISDEEIAVGIDFAGDPAHLIQSLVDSRWLDRSDEHRLIVHDWHEHDDDGVKLRLKRAELPFLSVRKETEPEFCRDMSRHIPTTRASNQQPEPVLLAAAAERAREEKPPEKPKAKQPIQMPKPPAAPPPMPPAADLEPVRQAVLEYFPSTNEQFAQRLAAAVRERAPDCTAEQIVAAMHETFRGGGVQVTAGLWLSTVPEYLAIDKRPPKREAAGLRKLSWEEDWIANG